MNGTFLRALPPLRRDLLSELSAENNRLPPLATFTPTSAVPAPGGFVFVRAALTGGPGGGAARLGGLALGGRTLAVGAGRSTSSMMSCVDINPHHVVRKVEVELL